MYPEYIFNKAYNSIIKREINSRMKREANYKKAQDLDRHFFTKKILIANKNMKRCLTSVVIR